MHDQLALCSATLDDTLANNFWAKVVRLQSAPNHKMDIGMTRTGIRTVGGVPRALQAEIPPA